MPSSHCGLEMTWSHAAAQSTQEWMGRRDPRRVYSVAFAVGFLGLVAGMWASLYFLGPPGAGTAIVLGFVMIAVGGLGWLRPHPGRYLLGTMLVTGYLTLLFLLRPGGPLAPAGYPVLALPLTMASLGLLPVGWVLLVSAVWSWRTGVVSYLLAWLAFGLPILLTAIPMFDRAWDAVQATAPWVALGNLLASALYWPMFLLMVYGVFGHRFG
jgi:hypothetical protein